MKIARKIVVLTLAIWLLSGFLVGCGQEAASTSDDSTNVVKKGILVTCFGTSYTDTREVCIESVVKDIDKAFPDYEVRLAFTAQFIIDKVAKRDNIKFDNPEEALTKMKEEGFTEVIVQPLHIIPGAEYSDLKDVVEEFNDGSFKKLALGEPVLAGIEDYRIAVDALKTQLPETSEKETVVVMGHGTEHYANACYPCLQSVINDKGLNVIVGTVEGYPSLDDVIVKLKKQKIKEVTLMPFMVVAGDHAQNDMAGDEKDSWKSILKKEGFIVNTYMHGLGENQAFHEIYINHVQKAIEGKTEV